VSGRAAYPWWMGPASLLGAGLLWLVGRTWRIEWVGAAEREADLARTGCVFAFWHARLLPLVFTHRGRDAMVLISRHRDGELIARIMERLGFRAARGSSTRGGEQGARELLRELGARRQIGITPDGPRGPAERAKPGAVFLASQSGLPIVPVASAASSAWVLRSWDGFRVPRPFARVVVGYGDPIVVPAALDAAAVEAWRARLEQAIAAVTREVTARAEGRP